jgi:hypothetical protein
MSHKPMGSTVCYRDSFSFCLFYYRPYYDLNWDATPCSLAKVY